MEVDWSESRCERSEERYRGETPIRDLEEGALDDSEEYDKEKSRDLSKGRSKDKKRSRREEKDHRSRDRDRSKTNDDLKEREKEVKDSEKDRTSSKEKRKEDREEHEKDRTKDKVREKDHDRDKHGARGHNRDKDEKDRARKRDCEREREHETESNRGRERESGKERSKDKEKEREKEKAKYKDRGKDREREKEKERTRDREKGRDREKIRDRDTLDREQGKDNSREKEREVDHDKDRSRDREKGSRTHREDHDHSRDGEKDSNAKVESDDYKDREAFKQGKTSLDEDDTIINKQGDYIEDLPSAPSQSQVELGQRILKMKEERLGKKSDSASEILSWVHRSRKLEEKRSLEKEKALQRSRIFEEQDNVDEDDDEADTAVKDALAGVKVLHGLDKVLEGGAVVLTLKDQDILANGDINEDVDMLENVEIGEQKRRSEAYKAAKKSKGIYDDKFNDEPGEEKKILPQYDDPAEEEGVTLAAGGRLTAEAEKKLEELRMRLQGGSVKNQAEDLNSSVKISSDYYTPEEILKFKQPKKKKSLRKKEKLDIDALEAEAISAGLGAEDLGSRNDNKRQAAREEQERSEAERRQNAYQTAYAKAEEASKALRMEQGITIAKEEDDAAVFADDAEDLQKSLERARKLALKKQSEKAAAGPEAIARLASSAINSQPADAHNSTFGEADNKVVFTEMEEFVWGLQLDEEAQKPTHEDVFMEEDEPPKAPEEKKEETGGWKEVADSDKTEKPKTEDNEEVVPDETIHEAPVGKGLAGALKMLKERGSLKETIEWGGRNMDKKKSKLVGIYDEEGPKEIHLERTDEYGRILTPKEAFRLLSHKFHGKGPGKMKLEKRMKQYQDELKLKLKQMTSSEALPQSVERMREAQAQLKTPYLVLSGHVKPGQTSDPRSGFATVEKEVPGSLTPMLGDKKVEHFLGIKRKAEPGSSSGAPKKPKP